MQCCRWRLQFVFSAVLTVRFFDEGLHSLKIACICVQCSVFTVLLKSAKFYNAPKQWLGMICFQSLTPGLGQLNKIVQQLSWRILAGILAPTNSKYLKSKARKYWIKPKTWKNIGHRNKTECSRAYTSSTQINPDNHFWHTSHRSIQRAPWSPVSASFICSPSRLGQLQLIARSCSKVFITLLFTGGRLVLPVRSCTCTLVGLPSFLPVSLTASFSVGLAASFSVRLSCTGAPASKSTSIAHVSKKMVKSSNWFLFSIDEKSTHGFSYQRKNQTRRNLQLE